ncbi:methylamine utilization protein [Skermanella aerolata]|uniref:Methylamine utilization protein n=1 Tax=Skermanella aerolata TaxID=393310 RepID=A0A512E4V6_9PROT|nr:plastocyanin/azurin family copper-binding protein [Skermanella aerolata]GEO43766.1 methylamine utilization protein [Skermanella aerolata]
MKINSLVALATLSLIAIGLSAEALAGTSISQKGKQFSQDAVTIKAGDKVTFVNDDTVAHNITVKDPTGGNHSGDLQKPGTQADLGFDKPGTHEVRCAIHPKMKMTVTAQ